LVPHPLGHDRLPQSAPLLHVTSHEHALRQLTFAHDLSPVHAIAHAPLHLTESHELGPLHVIMHDAAIEQSTLLQQPSPPHVMVQW
jgi:hypothetical protein